MMENEAIICSRFKWINVYLKKKIIKNLVNDSMAYHFYLALHYYSYLVLRFLWCFVILF